MSDLVEREEVAKIIDDSLRGIVPIGDLIWTRPGGPSVLARNTADAILARQAARIVELEAERDEAKRRQRELQTEYNGVRASERKAARRALAAEALSGVKEGAWRPPEGYVLVPREPDIAMNETLSALGRTLISEAHERDNYCWFALKAYRAMIAAAPPTTPAKPEGERHERA